VRAPARRHNRHRRSSGSGRRVAIRPGLVGDAARGRRGAEAGRRPPPAQDISSSSLSLSLRLHPAAARTPRTVLRWSLPPSIVIIAAGPSGRSPSIIALVSSRRGAARPLQAFTPSLPPWLLQQSACCSVHSVSARARVDPPQLN